MQKQSTFGKIMTFRYLLVLGLLAILSVFAYFILLSGIKTMEHDANVINISGRQRMLSQRIEYLCMHLIMAQNISQQDEVRQEMQDAVDLMEESHNGLVYGSQKMRLPGNPSAKLKAVYFESPLFLDKQVHEFISRVRSVLKALPEEISLNNSDISYILRTAHEDLLMVLDAAVKEYETESEKHLANLKHIEALLLFLGILVLLIMAVSIFRPLAHRIQIEINKAKSIEESLRLANQNIEGIIRAAPLAIISIDLQGRVKAWNPAAERIFGWTKEEVLEKFLPIVPKDKLDEHVGLRERVLKGKTLSSVEVKRQKKDGSIIDVSLSVAPLYDITGKVTGLMGIIEDINERKFIQEALKVSEERLRTLIENVPDCICNISLLGKFIRMNETGCRLRGLDSQELIGTNYGDEVTQNRRELEEGFKESSRGKTVSVQYKTLTKKGEEIWWDAKLTPLRNISGAVESILRVSRDVTEQIAVQERQKNIVSGLRTIMAIADKLITCPETISLLKMAVEEARSSLSLERCAIFLENNGYMQGTFGTDRYGKTTDERNHRFPKDSAWQKYTDTRRAGEAQWFMVHEPYLEWDGSKNVGIGAEGWIAITPIRSGKEVIGVFVNDKAISKKPLDAVQQEILSVYSSLLGAIIERKRFVDLMQISNQFNENLLKTIPFGMDIVDETGTILYINDHLKKILGKEAIGKKCWEMYKDNKEQCAPCPLKKGIELGKVEMLEINHAFGGKIICITHTGMMYEDKKAILEIYEDITKERGAEQKLREALAVKSEFISMVSHELRTPLTAIKEGIAIVTDESVGKVNPEQKNFLEIAERNVLRLSRFINNVLDYQKLDSGRMEFYIKSGNINDTVKEVKEDMLFQADTKGLKLELDLADNLPLINFDTDKITQVLSNLLHNAIKFTESGLIKIATAKIDDALRVSVSDTGIGIKKEDIRRLFQDFSQLATGKERKTGSTGLGLAISRKLIIHHGGQIWAESEFGKGTTFYFTLPIK